MFLYSPWNTYLAYSSRHGPNSKNPLLLKTINCIYLENAFKQQYTDKSLTTDFQNKNLCIYKVCRTHNLQIINHTQSYFCPACRILVSLPGIEPRPQQWKHRVLTTGPQGNSHTIPVIVSSREPADSRRLFLTLAELSYLQLTCGCSLTRILQRQLHPNQLILFPTNLLSLNRIYDL